MPASPSNRSVDTSSILDSFRPYPALGPLIDNFRESFDRYIGAKGLPKVHTYTPTTCTAPVLYCACVGAACH
jgi:hypothetical protein